MNLAARIISILFHPLLMVTYLFSFFAIYFPMGLEPFGEGSYERFIFLIFCLTFLFPVLVIGVIKSMGLIRSFQMGYRQERILPFFLIAILYVTITVLFYVRYRISFHDNVLKFLVIADVLIILAALITISFKVSIHSLSACGVIGIMIPLNKVVEDGTFFYPTIIVMVLAGLVMSARLQLNAHSLREVFVGGAVGIVSSFVTAIILL